MGEPRVEHQHVSLDASSLNDGNAVGRHPFANGVDAARQVRIRIQVRIDRRLAGIVDGPLRPGQRSADLIRLSAGFMFALVR